MQRHEGFVPVANYLSELHSFGGDVNFDSLRVYVTRLRRPEGDAQQQPTAVVQLRTGADDTPLVYFRRDRDTGSQVEVSFTEFDTRPWLKSVTAHWQELTSALEGIGPK